MELRHNIKQYFWQKFISEREDVYGMGAAILMPEKVWEASGHTQLLLIPWLNVKFVMKESEPIKPK